MTDETPLNIATVWSTMLHKLMGGDWDEDVSEAVDTAMEAKAALALKYAHDTIEAKDRGYGDEGAMAVLKAAHAWRNGIFLSPADVLTMTDNFAARYDETGTPLQDFLDDHHDGLRVEWLNETGRSEIQAMVRTPNEIWIDDDNLPGVWVFKDPDHRSHS